MFSETVMICLSAINFTNATAKKKTTSFRSQVCGIGCELGFMMMSCGLSTNKHFSHNIINGPFCF